MKKKKKFGKADTCFINQQVSVLVFICFRPKDFIHC